MRLLHDSLELQCVTYVDDCLLCGSRSNLLKLYSDMSKSFELKMKSFGPDANEERSGLFLGRTISWERGGLRWEVDQRHAQRLIKEWGYEGAKGVCSPGPITRTQ